MPDINYYGAVTKLETDETLVVEYRFTVGVLPVSSKLIIHRAYNNATFEQLLREAVSYARTHYTMLEERNN